MPSLRENEAFKQPDTTLLEQFGYPEAEARLTVSGSPMLQAHVGNQERRLRLASIVSLDDRGFLNDGTLLYILLFLNGI